MDLAWLGFGWIWVDFGWIRSSFTRSLVGFDLISARFRLDLPGFPLDLGWISAWIWLDLGLIIVLIAVAAL